MRNSVEGKAAKEAGTVLQLRVNGAVKMTTGEEPKKGKKRPSKEGAAKKAAPAKKKPKSSEEGAAPAAPAAEPADGDAADGGDGSEEPETVMVKQSGYAHFSAVNREGVKAAIEGDAANAELPPKERNQMVMTKLGANWSALDDAAKAKWKDEAPMVEKKAKKKADKDDDDGETVMVKQTGYAHFMAVNREGVKAAIEGDAANAELPPKERNQMILKNLGANWSALDDAAKAKWKDEAPMVEKKAKKAKEPKEPKAPKEKKAGGRDTIRDQAELQEKMDADGWTKEEKPRGGDSAHVDKYYLPPAGSGGKRCRSILEVARAAYPEHVVAGTNEKKEKKAPAEKKAKKAPEPAPEKPATKSIEEYYLGNLKPGKPDAKAPEPEEPKNPFEDDGDAKMDDAPAADEPAAEEPAAAEEAAAVEEAPAAVEEAPAAVEEPAAAGEEPVEEPAAPAEEPAAPAEEPAAAAEASDAAPMEE